MRTGEHSAAIVATRFLASKVVMNANGAELASRAAVIDRITGQWAFTPVRAQGEWSLPEKVADGVQVTAEFPGLGAAPSDYSVMFWFDERDPEVEQRHDIGMTGAAVIIDVSRIHGTSPKGPVLVVIE